MFAWCFAYRCIYLPTPHSLAAAYAGYVGDVESALADAFAAAEARPGAAVFLDDIDAVCPSRESASSHSAVRTVAFVLTLLDGVVGKGSVRSGDKAVFFFF